MIIQVQFVCLFVFLALQPFGCIFHSPVVGFTLLILEVSRSHTTTCHSRQESPGRVINPSQRPLPDNIQHSQQTNIHHAPAEIRTHILSAQAAVDPRLRPRGYCDRQYMYSTDIKNLLQTKLQLVLIYKGQYECEWSPMILTIIQNGARKTGSPSRRPTWAQVSDSVQEIKQMQMQSTYWLEKVLKMISLYVIALL